MKRIFQRLLPLVLTLLFCCTAMAKEKWFNWEKSIELIPGIRHVYQDIRKPRIMKLNIVRVDLNHKNIVLTLNHYLDDVKNKLKDTNEILKKILLEQY